MIETLIFYFGMTGKKYAPNGKIWFKAQDIQIRYFVRGRERSIRESSMSLEWALTFYTCNGDTETPSFVLDLQVLRSLKSYWAARWTIGRWWNADGRRSLETLKMPLWAWCGTGNLRLGSLKTEKSYVAGETWWWRQGVRVIIFSLASDFIVDESNIHKAPLVYLVCWWSDIYSYNECNSK